MTESCAIHEKRFFFVFTNLFYSPLLFAGNTEDTFKVGLSLTKKSLKLYADFYSSDIIVASPLGLRMIIGAEGERNREYDFLASVEVLVLDQTELFLMQVSKAWCKLICLIGQYNLLTPSESLVYYNYKTKIIQIG